VPYLGGHGGGEITPGTFFLGSKFNTPEVKYLWMSKIATVRNSVGKEGITKNVHL